jgi:hypothetical protein
VAVVERLEWLGGELEAASRNPDGKEEPRDAAYVLCAVRDLLAADLVQPASEIELTKLVEQMPPRNGIYRE